MLKIKELNNINLSLILFLFCKSSQLIIKKSYIFTIFIISDSVLEILLENKKYEISSYLYISYIMINI